MITDDDFFVARKLSYSTRLSEDCPIVLWRSLSTELPGADNESPQVRQPYSLALFEPKLWAASFYSLCAWMCNVFKTSTLIVTSCVHAQQG